MEQNNDIQAALDYITGAGHGDFPPEIEDTIKRVLKSALTAQQPSADAKAALDSLREIIDDLKCLSITGELTKNQNEEIETIRATLTAQQPNVNQELLEALKSVLSHVEDEDAKRINGQCTLCYSYRKMMRDVITKAEKQGA